MLQLPRVRHRMSAPRPCSDVQRRSTHVRSIPAGQRVYVAAHDVQKVIGGGSAVQKEGQVQRPCQLQLQWKVPPLGVCVAKVEPVWRLCAEAMVNAWSTHRS